jgi:peptidoglycan hydrolase-like protein with peptidoglycan-binding domain
VRVYTKYQVSGKSRRKKPGRTRALVVGLFALLGIATWLAVQSGFVSRVKQSDGATPIAIGSSQPVEAKALHPPSPIKESTPSPQPTGTDSLSLARTAAILDAQVALDRIGISPGSIDGVPGSQTRAAIRAFQLREGLPLTGELDTNTRARITLASPPLVTCRVEAADLARLLPLASTWLGKSEQPRLDYETMLECIAERSHAHPSLIKKLNSTAEWMALLPGTELNAPAVTRDPPRSKAAFLRIRLGERTLQAFDATNRLLAHFPCSIASRVEKRPVGELRVTVLVPNPDYMFNPENFPESAEAQELGRKLHIKPGPNNPVGTAWIGLNLSGYGIHGTPRPEEVGRTESHGCFRLANWNAEYLLQLVTTGTPVRIEP